MKHQQHCHRTTSGLLTEEDAAPCNLHNLSTLNASKWWIFWKIQICFRIVIDINMHVSFVKFDKQFQLIASKNMKTEEPQPLEAGEPSKRSSPRHRVSRGLSAMDFLLRIIAAAGTLGSAIAMGTTDETLPFFTQFFQFTAEYNDFPTFTFFVIANSIVCAYLVFSLPLSVFHIFRSAAKNSRIILIIFDTVMLALLTAGASAAAATVYLAHNGNANANWLAICQQFTSFCERISGSLIGSFGGAVALMLLIITSAVAISRC